MGFSHCIMFIYMCVYVFLCNLNVCIYGYIKLVTIVEGVSKAPFLIATTPNCRGGRYSIPWIAPPLPLFRTL